MILSVQCPHCKQRMKTNPKEPAKATKRCVYCGKSFKLVHEKGNQILGPA